MKKIFFYVLMFMMIGKVSANDILYSKWSVEYPSGIPKRVIESEVRYKWYEEETFDVEYLKKEDIYNKLVDYDDYKTYESGELLDEPIKFNDRVIKKEYKDYKFEKNTIDYIVLTNPDDNDKVGISEVMIFDGFKAKKLSPSFDKKYSILNDDKKDKFVSLKPGDKIYINLNEECEADNIRIFIYYESYPYTNKLTIEYNAHKDYPIFRKSVNLMYCTLCESYTVGTEGMEETNRTYKLNVYKYIDKYYKTYRIKKTYKDGYYSSYDGLKKDEKSKKTFYRYLKYKLIVYLPDGTTTDNFDKCGKNSCIFKLEEIEYPKVEEKKEVEIEVPKTLDSFSIIGFLISFIFFIVIVIYIIKTKCRKVSYE